MKVTLAARVQPDLYAKVEAIALKEDRTLSYVVERLLREALEKKAKRA